MVPAMPDDLPYAEVAALFGLAGPGADERVRRAIAPALEAARLQREIRAVGAPSANLRKLEHARKALASFLEQANEAMAEPADHPDGFNPLKTALLWHFARTIDPANPERSFPDGRAEAAVDEALATMAELRDGIDALAIRFEDAQRPGKGGPRRSADAAARDAIELLAVAYVELKFSQRLPLRRAVSPETIAEFVDFLRYLLPYAHVHVHSGEALRKQVERMRADGTFD